MLRTHQSYNVEQTWLRRPRAEKYKKALELDSRVRTAERINLTDPDRTEQQVFPNCL